MTLSFMSSFVERSASVPLLYSSSSLLEKTACPIFYVQQNGALQAISCNKNMKDINLICVQNCNQDVTEE